jgi:DNA-binding GntR family transcriptional regulator
MQLMSSLQLEAYNYIKNLILTHQLDANTLYSETKLSKELGISRTPMREALQCLSQDGYITVIPSKGFRIRQLSQKDMKETIQIRCAIEGFCTQCLANEYNTSKGQQTIERLGEILKKQKESLSANDDYESFINYDHEFHLVLVNYIENEEINHMFQRLMYLIRLTTQSALEVEGRSIGTVDEHEEYFKMLKAGNGNEAYRILISHLMMPLNIVKPEI